MTGNRKEPTKKRPPANTRLKTDLPFEEAVKRLLNTPPPEKGTNQPKEVDESRSE